MELIAIYLIAGVARRSGVWIVRIGRRIDDCAGLAFAAAGGNRRSMSCTSQSAHRLSSWSSPRSTPLLRHRRGDLDWALFWRIAPRVVIGAVLGAICGDLLPGLTLRVFFIGFVGYTIARALHRRYGGAVSFTDSEKIQVPPPCRVARPCGSTDSLRVSAELCSGREQPSLSCRTFAPRDAGSSSHRPSRRVFPRLSAWVQAQVTWPVD